MLISPIAMRTSRRRRAVRANLFGSTKNRRGTRWIGIAPVRGVTKVLVFGQGSREKASEGVEKSCRKRRSHRGLRRGKARARGGKPRTRPSPTANADIQHVDRKVRRLLRQMAYWDVRLRSFEREFRSEIEERKRKFSNLDPLTVGTTDRWGNKRALVFSPYALFRKRAYLSLLGRIKKRCPKYSPLGWLVFLDSRLGYSFPGELNEAASVLEELALRAGEAARAHRVVQQYGQPSNTTPLRVVTPRGGKTRTGERNRPSRAPPVLPGPKGKGKEVAASKPLHVCTGVAKGVRTPCRICGKLPQETDAFKRLFG